jgi:hypothetical protein
MRQLINKKRAILLGAALLLGGMCLAPVFAQEQYNEVRHLFQDLAAHRQPSAGTEFVFARVEYSNFYRSRGYPKHQRLEGWGHDYPVAEEHILQVASEATGINVNKMSYVIVDLASDEIFKYPFLYFSEVGEMDLTDHEVANWREHLNRGGFAMIDDFDSSRDDLGTFLVNMRRVFPGRDFPLMKLDHPIFHTFYEIPTLDVKPPYEVGEPPKFLGYYDDRGRLLMILNYNNDVGDFWEWIDQPRYPLQPSTEGLRFGINYLLYSMTH